MPDDLKIHFAVHQTFENVNQPIVEDESKQAFDSIQESTEKQKQELQDTLKQLNQTTVKGVKI